VRRVLVLGCGGSGKTVLANRLGPALGVTVVHLDALFYGEGFEPVPAEEFARRQQEMINTVHGFVADGNYASTLALRAAAADTIVWLAPHPLVCLAGILARRRRYRGGVHADGVHDRITLDFARYGWGYRRRSAPRVEAILAEHATGAEVHRFTSRRQAAVWLDRTVAAVVDGSRSMKDEKR
jgi:adenylate kinase family enzyme